MIESHIIICTPTSSAVTMSILASVRPAAELLGEQPVAGVMVVMVVMVVAVAMVVVVVAMVVVMAVVVMIVVAGVMVVVVVMVVAVAMVVVVAVVMVVVVMIVVAGVMKKVSTVSLPLGELSRTFYHAHPPFPRQTGSREPAHDRLCQRS